MGAVHKSERLDLRIPHAIERKIEWSKGPRGEVVNNVIADNISQNAGAMACEAEVIELSDRDRDRLLAMLAAPAPPNAALRRAAERYRTLFG